MGMQPFLGVALTQPDERFTKFTFEDMARRALQGKQLPGGWIAMIQHYFLSAWIPNPDQTHTYSTRVTRRLQHRRLYQSRAGRRPGPEGQVSAPVLRRPQRPVPLEEISPYLDLSVDYGWLWWIAQPLFWLLTKIHTLVGNWGVASYPADRADQACLLQALSATSYKSMANMRRVQPKMQEIRERYADDKQKQSQAMMDLYRKEKINPMGGCLPILVQMPVFIALYWVLMESVELRHAPFFGWIERPVGHGPLFRAAAADGRQHVVHAEAQPAAAGSHAGQDHAVDAGHLYLLLPLVPRWPGPVLGNQQPPVHGPAVRTSPARSRRRPEPGCTAPVDSDTIVAIATAPGRGGVGIIPPIRRPCSRHW